jgi:Acetyltransferase (GNAT) domain
MEFQIIRAFPGANVETAWRSLLTRVELPSHYTAPEFFLEEHLANRRPFAVLSMQQGAVTGVLTGVHEGKTTMSGLPVRPQICLDRRTDKIAASQALVRGLLEEAGSSDLIQIYSWAWDPLPTLDKLGFRFQHWDGPVLLDLTLPLDQLFAELDKKRRNNVRFAIKNGLEFSEISEEKDFLAYYQEVYCHWRDTPRKQVEGAETSLEGFARRFKLGGNRKLFVAKAQGKTAAGAFFRLQTGGLFEFAAGSSLDEFLGLKPNDFLQWKAIEWAQRTGFLNYSLGGSGQFHRQFGGVVASVNRYRADRTWLRQHDVKDGVKALSKKILRFTPYSARAIRKQSV